MEEARRHHNGLVRLFPFLPVVRKIYKSRVRGNANGRKRRYIINRKLTKSFPVGRNGTTNALATMTCLISRLLVTLSCKIEIRNHVSVLVNTWSISLYDTLFWCLACSGKELLQLSYLHSYRPPSCPIIDSIAKSPPLRIRWYLVEVPILRKCYAFLQHEWSSLQAEL
ncbi:hypothetical protein I7I48_06073 [Histoplasma ohiense]|nr:hypothetical protein I7I48_06073 [Histoplasma ohiense (nom. inval.)]